MGTEGGPAASATDCQGHAHICAFRFSRVNSGYEVDWIAYLKNRYMCLHMKIDVSITGAKTE
jgi:hypothetical protein